MQSEFVKANQVALVIGVASSGRLLPVELAIALATQVMPVHTSSGYIAVKGKPVDEARQEIAERALDHGAKYLWFVDDDTVPPRQAIRQLIYALENDPQAMACGGIYVTRQNPPFPVVFNGIGQGSFWRWKVGQVFECTGIGAGCLMIKTEIFQQLEKPWFKFLSEPPADYHTGGAEISEDIYFCESVRKAGYKVLAHGGVLCDHYDTASGQIFSLPTDTYPYQPVSAESPQLESQK